jgi:hypothetical protein
MSRQADAVLGFGFLQAEGPERLVLRVRQGRAERDRGGGLELARAELAGFLRGG